MVSGLQLTQRNLIITGYIEPNKPRIGREVAQRLHMPFVDVEQQIESRYGEPLKRLRETMGERHARAIESEIVDEVVLNRKTVIRVNGSMLVHSGHLERMQETGPVICLVARLDAVLQRIHLMLGARYHNPGERDIALGDLRREWQVRGRPGVVELDATYRSEEETASELIRLWQELAIERA